MNRAFLSAWAALSIAASLPGLGLAQGSRLDLSERPSALHRIIEQLDRLGGRIDREVAQGRLARPDADRARREINSIQDQMNADREEHGGRVTVADRFDLQARIDRLKENLRQERINAAKPPAA
jgi:hypothetical protein